MSIRAINCSHRGRKGDSVSSNAGKPYLLHERLDQTPSILSAYHILELYMWAVKEPRLSISTLALLIPTPTANVDTKCTEQRQRLFRPSTRESSQLQSSNVSLNIQDQGCRIFVSRSAHVVDVSHTPLLEWRRVEYERHAVATPIRIRSKRSKCKTHMGSEAHSNLRSARSALRLRYPVVVVEILF